MKISVLIPAYNEKENLEELLSHIHKFREKEDIDWEFIIIDDGSTDGSFELLKKLHDRYPYIKVIKHRRNFGLTEALLTGLHHSTGDALVFFPADLQFHLEDVKRMVDKMENGYDLVAGKKKGKYEKKFVSRIYNLLSQKLFNINVSDMNSIKVMKREILELVPHRKGWHRYIIPLAHEYGYRMTEVEVRLYPRMRGKSKFRGLWRIIVGVTDLIAVKFQLSFIKSPMLFFGTLSLISFVLGVIIFLIALILRFMGHGYRPILYVVMTFLIGSLIFLTMGSLGEMIAGLRDRPSDDKKFKVEDKIE
ncbi:MAG TPA: glycosyltransferase family 2 protein [candidate division WOR-3 bacterium]|uniref:Glycosyltransferase family 2 protein n=1 Tax=candidate division WOR-3 bacterium TaxID=2052148 RepID=A0A7V5HNB2_UNCW3|nr:glycosyltransferase family 2 protein [candidate division WOR-3 bacterium]